MKEQESRKVFFEGTFKAGTVVHIKGLPVKLLDDTRVYSDSLDLICDEELTGISQESQ